jgi:hypothetical protein
VSALRHLTDVEQEMVCQRCVSCSLRLCAGAAAGGHRHPPCARVHYWHGHSALHRHLVGSNCSCAHICARLYAGYVPNRNTVCPLNVRHSEQGRGYVCLHMWDGNLMQALAPDPLAACRYQRLEKPSWTPWAPLFGQVSQGSAGH